MDERRMRRTDKRKVEEWMKEEWEGRIREEKKNGSQWVRRTEKSILRMRRTEENKDEM